ncbi:hypothetical protein [Actinoplanes philippinensis]|uniref:hypothetical protein n=1 Tax=Actinoplanes philippinensis TaxID=35752 RepID=UPI003405F887
MTTVAETYDLPMPPAPKHLYTAPNGDYIVQGRTKRGADESLVPTFEVRGKGGGVAAEGWITLGQAVQDLCSIAGCTPEELDPPASLK